MATYKQIQDRIKEQHGFVAGSMGDDALIIDGVESDAAKASLYSTIHCACRLFGRKEAKRRFSRAEMDACCIRAAHRDRRRSRRESDGLSAPAGGSCRALRLGEFVPLPW